MGKIKNLHRLKQKEIRSLQQELNDRFQMNIPLFDSNVETGKQEDNEFVYIDKKPCFFRYDNDLFFTIIGLMQFKPSKGNVVVDMGAIQFVTNGADVMAPGIVNADECILVDDPVWICDETHKKPLAVGIAIISGIDMVHEKKGKAVKIIHHVGDDLWNMMKIFM